MFKRPKKRRFKPKLLHFTVVHILYIGLSRMSGRFEGREFPSEHEALEARILPTRKLFDAGRQGVRQHGESWIYPPGRFGDYRQLIRRRWGSLIGCNPRQDQSRI